MTKQTDWNEIATGELAHVTGGESLLGSLYKTGVFNVAAKLGGPKLAEKMYGSHVTAADKARAESALEKFLVDGDKLPKGVPDLFR